MVPDDMFTEFEKGNVLVVGELLDLAEIVNIAHSVTGNTLLHLAAWRGYGELVRYLLDQGASIDRVNKLGQTALLMALLKGHSTTARLLIERGANIAPDQVIPHLLFAMSCDTVVVVLLINKITDMNYMVEGTYVLQSGCCSFVKFIMMLWSRGIYLNMKSMKFWRQLDHLLFDSSSDVVDCFIRTFPDMIHLKDSKGWTRLHSACADDNSKVVQCLLNNGAEIDRPANNGDTPLHIALRNGKLRVADILLDRGAKLCIKDNKGNTPLHLAAVGLQWNGLVFRKLLDRGARVDVRNMNNDTPYDLCQKDERYQILVEHITKLRVAGLFLDLKNKVDDTEMRAECLLEMDKMQKTKIIENVSLKVVLSNERNPYYLKNKKLDLRLDRFIHSPRALRCFPLYINILWCTLQNSKYRFTLLTNARQILERNQFWNMLPALVQDDVLLYLNNDDLEKLCNHSISSEVVYMDWDEALKRVH